MTTDYKASDIKVLSDREHVRLRTNVYLGSTAVADLIVPDLSLPTLSLATCQVVPAALKAVGEIIDNAVDEFTQLPKQKNRHLKIHATPSKGLFSIEDNGRGVPIDKHETGPYTPQVVFGSLRSGRNFSADAISGVAGVNGVGSSCTNFCSTRFHVDITRTKKQYQQTFTNGALSVTEPTITPTGSSQTGTKISFELDPSVFSMVAVPEVLIRNKAIEVAAANPGVTTSYNGTKYFFKNGLLDVVKQLVGTKPIISLPISSKHATGVIYVVPGATDLATESMFTLLNSSLLFDGGKCNTQFVNALVSRVETLLETKTKRAKIKLAASDVLHGLLIMADLKMARPQYDSQAKTRMTGPCLRADMAVLMDVSLQDDRHMSEWLKDVFERAAARYHIEANGAATKEMQKAVKRQQLNPDLLDATGSDRSKCRLLIVEGESAKGQICEARDPTTTAAYALTGKINNVWGATPAQVVKMGKLADLLAVIGLVPGVPVDRSALKYGQIVISTDADYDGDDIFTLLVNIFHMWPSLFDPSHPPIVFRLAAPNVCLVKGQHRVHFATFAEYDAAKHKYKGYEVRYYKGLGSLSMKDWEMVLQDPERMVPIVDADGTLKDTLELWFGKEASRRRDQLMGVSND